MPILAMYSRLLQHSCTPFLPDALVQGGGLWNLFRGLDVAEERPEDRCVFKAQVQTLGHVWQDGMTTVTGQDTGALFRAPCR